MPGGVKQAVPGWHQGGVQHRVLHHDKDCVEQAVGGGGRAGLPQGTLVSLLLKFLP